MKRVIVVSDSHGMEDRLRQVLQQAFSLGPVDVIVFLGDGLSELVLVRNPGSLAEFNNIVDGVLRQSYDNKNLLIFHTHKARFTFEKPVAWTRDGEAGGEYREIELCNYHRPIQLIF